MLVIISQSLWFHVRTSAMHYHFQNALFQFLKALCWWVYWVVQVGKYLYWMQLKYLATFNHDIF